MSSLSERITEYAEATPIQADDLLPLGDRAVVARSLSRIALGTAPASLPWRLHASIQT